MRVITGAITRAGLAVVGLGLLGVGNLAAGSFHHGPHNPLVRHERASTRVRLDRVGLGRFHRDTDSSRARDALLALQLGELREPALVDARAPLRLLLEIANPCAALGQLRA